ncbi:MAG: hypothetical protein N2643_01995 [Endomicrobia bacterium]|nr:hypothetical protein [Endomicrobiia bacterium]
MTKTKIVIITYIFTFLAESLFSSFEYGGIRDIGARACGMGGAYISASSDADMLYWNSACLSKNTRFRQFSLSYSRHFIDILPQGFVAFSTPDRGMGSLGVGGLLFGSGGIYSENVGLISYSKNIQEISDILLGAGLTLKYMNKSYLYEINNVINKESVSNIGFDVGISFQKGEREKNLSLAAVYRSYISKEEKLEDYIRVGVSYTFPMNEKSTLIACDYDLASKGLHLGLEMEVVSGLLVVRGGYNQSGVEIVSKNYSAGFGIVYMPWRLDYALVKPVDLEVEVIHKFSLDIKF